MSITGPVCRLAPLAAIAATLACGAALAQEPATRFEELDLNGDGQLTREELPARLRRNFDLVDADGNGSISPVEDRRFRYRSRNLAEIPESIQLFRDLPYAENDHPRQTLHLLVPRKPSSKEPIPVIVYIHGGGWRNGEKTSGLQRLIPFVRSGRYAGVTIGYRLSNEARWPQQIYDCKAAIRWIRGQASRYGLDPSRIGAIGTSAGGHLVSMLGVSGDVEALEGDLGRYNDESSRVSCVVNMYGPSELLTMDDHPSRIVHNADDSPESLLIGGPIQQHRHRARSASPVMYVTRDDAPFLHIHGLEDPLVPYPQSQKLHALLRNARVPSTLVAVEEGGHGRFRNPEIDERIEEFFARHLNDADVEISSQTVKQGPPN